MCIIKKRLSIVCIALAVAGVLPAFGTDAHAGEAGGYSLMGAESVVTAADTTTTPGKTIDYALSIEGNPGLASFNFKLKFDTAAISVTTDSEGVVCNAGDAFSGGGLVCNTTSDGVNIFWNNSSDVKADGVLFSLPLKIADAAALGEYIVEPKLIAQNTVNKAEEPVALSLTNSKITIREFVPKIKGGAQAVKAGDSFDFSIFLEDNPGIAGMDVQIIFDRNAFALEADGEAEAGSDEASALYTAKGSSTIPGTLLAKGYANAAEVFWSNARDTIYEGEFIKLHMKAKDGALPGDYTISLQSVAENTLNADEERVSLQAVNGTISIEAEPAYLTAFYKSGRMLSIHEGEYDSASGKVGKAARPSDCDEVRVFTLLPKNGWRPYRSVKTY